MNYSLKGVGPKIIDGILSGKPVYCYVWDGKRKTSNIEQVIFVVNKTRYITIDKKYGHISGWEHAEPVEKVTYVKSAKEILK